MFTSDRKYRVFLLEMHGVLNHHHHQWISGSRPKASISVRSGQLQHEYQQKL